MAKQTTTLRRGRTRLTTKRRPADRSTRSARPASRPRADARTPRPSRSGTRQRHRQAPTDRGIQRFLERFTQALTAGDGRAAAACFEYPSLMVMSAVGRYGGNQPIPDEASAASFFGQAPQQYHAKGIEQTFPDVEDVQWIAHDLAVVEVHFPYIGADGNDLGDGERSVYVVRRQGRDHAICAAITLGTDSERPPIRSRRRSRRSDR